MSEQVEIGYGLVENFTLITIFFRWRNSTWFLNRGEHFCLAMKKKTINLYNLFGNDKSW